MGGRTRWGGERSCARGLGEGEGEGDLGGGVAGGPHLAGRRRRLQPPAQGVACAQGEGGWAVRGGSGQATAGPPSRPKAVKGGRAGPPGSRPKREGGVPFYFLFAPKTLD
jgi:hypothetical protein